LGAGTNGDALEAAMAIDHSARRIAAKVLADLVPSN